MDKSNNMMDEIRIFLSDGTDKTIRGRCAKERTVRF